MTYKIIGVWDKWVTSPRNLKVSGLELDDALVNMNKLIKLNPHIKGIGIESEQE